ncbi:MAG: THUMP domain-containing class I SAM-dependent RNA methyltransferase [Bacteriovorax sp.]
MNLTDAARFFIVYPLNLEDLGLVELVEKFKLHFEDETLAIIAKIPGGIEIECPLNIGLNLNRVLRTPTRILLRLSEFKCRDFPKLFQKMSKFNWAPWMIGQTPEVVCASKNSRLFDSRKIEKAIGDGINQYYRHKPVKKRYLDHLETTKKEHLPKIYFRAEDDLVTLSIDTTGERLHLRGEKTLTGLAPIRENLAALLLIELKSHVQAESITLIDPMCGSGTFLIEAKNSHSITSARDFSFLHMPIAMEGPALLKELDQKLLEKKDAFKDAFYDELIGFEISPEVVSLAKKNDPDLFFKQEDLFSETIHHYKNPVVIVNPPYGIRIGSDIDLDYFLRVIDCIKKKFQPLIAGIIVPSDFKLKTTKEAKIISSRPFKNGGIDVVFYVLGFK